MKRIRSGDGFEVQVPESWQRLGEGEDAFTLADPSGGTGALQISTALNATDERPGLQDLRDVIEALAASNGLGEPSDTSWFELEGLRGALSTFHHGEDFIRVWSVTDGKSFALATYVCRWGSESAELELVDGIVRSLTFGPVAQA
ncbi:MAG: hypothetical protein JNK82_02305 [Myxococcaceae bacterium]|nr:hypothetical protein [Myxococcaceae bacterium]